MSEKIQNYWFIGKTAENEEVWKFAARGPRDGLPAGIQYVRDEDVPSEIRPNTDGVADVWIPLESLDDSLARTVM